ncbi:hypothetical protein [Candidatus Enterococcus murrayae]|uniref:PsbP C-terminal domain-containing protein n=1 Tax=Candidatus Enterococcus murrayae TaxID=2815321 RepID=A0ABS3HCJ4_9ENTE|nr:hypothetical protein [Enterococcus sp. MJM16]MBO0451167.1 hypothetical protein [Enterococcus sp. MJM16]
MKKSIFTTTFFTLFCLLLSGCSQLPSTSSNSQSEQTTATNRQNTFSSSASSEAIFLRKNITGISGSVYQLTFPSDWIEEVDPLSQNKDLEFMIYDKQEREFVACISENKEDFTTLDAYAELVSQRLTRTNNMQIQFNDELMNGEKIKVCEFVSDVQGLKLSYIYQIIETKNHYVQLYGWTFTRLFETSRDWLRNIMSSFDEM